MELTSCTGIHKDLSVGLGSKRKRCKYADNPAACCAMSDQVLPPTHNSCVLCQDQWNCGRLTDGLKIGEMSEPSQIRSQRSKGALQLLPCFLLDHSLWEKLAVVPWRHLRNLWWGPCGEELRLPADRHELASLEMDPPTPVKPSGGRLQVLTTSRLQDVRDSEPEPSG